MRGQIIETKVEVELEDSSEPTLKVETIFFIKYHFFSFQNFHLSQKHHLAKYMMVSSNVRILHIKKGHVKSMKPVTGTRALCKL